MHYHAYAVYQPSGVVPLLLLCLAVEDLMQLVQVCRSQPDMELRLREVLNMARDAEKYRNLTRILTNKVGWVWHDICLESCHRPYQILIQFFHSTTKDTQLVTKAPTMTAICGRYVTGSDV